MVHRLHLSASLNDATDIAETLGKRRWFLEILPFPVSNYSVHTLCIAKGIIRKSSSARIFNAQATNFTHFARMSGFLINASAERFETGRGTISEHPLRFLKGLAISHASLKDAELRENKEKNECVWYDIQWSTLDTKSAPQLLKNETKTKIKWSVTKRPNTPLKTKLIILGLCFIDCWCLYGQR